MHNPPKGSCDLDDLKAFYRIVQGDLATINSSEEDIIRRVQLDLTCSLDAIIAWEENMSNADADAVDRFGVRQPGSLEKLKRRLIKAKSIEDAVVAIDTVINAYHELGPFLASIITDPWEETKAFLDQKSL